MTVVEIANQTWAGLASDTKPTGAVAGARYISTDTGRIEVYNGTFWLTSKSPQVERTGQWEDPAAVVGTGLLGSLTSTNLFSAINLVIGTQEAAIRFHTTTTSGTYGGIQKAVRITSPGKNPVFSFRFKVAQTTNCRCWIGFKAANSNPIADEPMASDNGFMFGFRTTDTTWVIAHNDGSHSTSIFDTSGLPAFDTNYHTVVMGTLNGGTSWFLYIDNTAYTVSTTQLPTNVSLYLYFGITNNAASDMFIDHVWSNIRTDGGM